MGIKDKTLLFLLFAVFFIVISIFLPKSKNSDYRKLEKNNPAKISVYPTPTTIASQSGILTQDSNSILFEVAKSDIEHTNIWFGTMLNVALVILAIIAIIATFLTLFTNEKAKEVDRLLEQGVNKIGRLDEALQNAAQSAAPPPDETQRSRTQEQLQNLAHAYFFERTYRLIFGSQLNILKILRSNPLTKPIVQSIHQRSRWNGIPFEDYIGFLINSALITYTPENDSYSITDLGEKFLDFLTQAGIPDKPD